MNESERRARRREALLRLKKTEEELGGEFRTRLITVVTTSVGVVAALFWQTAITDTIKTFIPVSGAWYYEIGVALTVTIIAALLLYWLSRQNSAK